VPQRLVGPRSARAIRGQARRQAWRATLTPRVRC
jgi:hypothetical protein